MRTYFCFLLITVFLLLIPSNALAFYDCDNRITTLVNPVRGRNLWIDKTITPLTDQYKEIAKHNFAATWLLQYDALKDREITKELNNFPTNQEKGIFLEVSPELAKVAGVLYPVNTPWAYPNAVFLSGYSQSERRKVIDVVFKSFKETFGNYPKSVGAWWIDSYSLSYMKQKYDITTSLIVADQKTTDRYGVWGQWWGVPYYPTKFNTLIPASSLSNKLDLVIVQWAQRHPDLALGNGPKYSNYSFQANDYISKKLDINFFNQMLDIYMSCNYEIAQVTVGLEIGMESSAFKEEYGRQLDVINERGLEVLTLSDFYAAFKKIYPTFPLEAKVSSNTTWDMNLHERKNILLNEYLVYPNGKSFLDKFIPDNSAFLDRNLQNLKPIETNTEFPFARVSFLTWIGILLILKKNRMAIIFSILTLTIYWFFFKDYVSSGYFVSYSPQFRGYYNALFLGFTVSWILTIIYTFAIDKLKLNTINQFFALILSISIWPLFSTLRYIKLNDTNYLGFAINSLKLVGFKFGRETGFFLHEFDFIEAASFLKIPFMEGSLILWFVIIPPISIMIALLLSLVAKYKKLKYALAFFALFFSVLYIRYLWLSDPVWVHEL